MPISAFAARLPFKWFCSAPPSFRPALPQASSLGELGTATKTARHEDKAGHLPPDWGKRLLKVLKDFSNDLWLVDEADDPHLSMAIRAGQGVRFMDLSDKVGSAFF